MVKTIVACGIDPILLMTRRMILEKSGYRVFTTMANDDAIKLITIQRPDVLILCHTLSIENCNELLEIARVFGRPIKTIILGHDDLIIPIGEQEQMLGPLPGPEQILATVDRMLNPGSRISR